MAAREEPEAAPAVAASQPVCAALAGADPGALKAVAAVWAVNLTDAEGEARPYAGIAGDLAAKFALVRNRPAMSNPKAVALALTLISKHKLGTADVKLISAGYFTSFVEGDREMAPLRQLSNSIIAVIAIIEAVSIGYTEWPAILSFYAPAVEPAAEPEPSAKRFKPAMEDEHIAGDEESGRRVSRPSFQALGPAHRGARNATLQAWGDHRTVGPLPAVLHPYAGEALTPTRTRTSTA